MLEGRALVFVLSQGVAQMGWNTCASFGAFCEYMNFKGQTDDFPRPRSDDTMSVNADTVFSCVPLVDTGHVI